MGPPVKRGKLIRDRLLCETIPPPPNNANNSPPRAMFGVTTRQVYDAMLEDPNCAGCHALMNPLGYAFENLDQLGRWRVSEYGEPVDASGSGHNTENNPVVIAGSCGGYLKTGQSLYYPQRIPHNGILVALANAMGVPTETYGDPMYGGELSDIVA